jgi:hypothetical protein
MYDILYFVPIKVQYSIKSYLCLRHQLLWGQIWREWRMRNPLCLSSHRYETCSNCVSHFRHHLSNKTKEVSKIDFGVQGHSGGMCVRRDSKLWGDSQFWGRNFDLAGSAERSFGHEKNASTDLNSSSCPPNLRRRWSIHRQKVASTFPPQFEGQGKRHLWTIFSLTIFNPILYIVLSHCFVQLFQIFLLEFWNRDSTFLMIPFNYWDLEIVLCSKLM